MWQAMPLTIFSYDHFSVMQYREEIRIKCFLYDLIRKHRVLKHQTDILWGILVPGMLARASMNADSGKL
jgi:hypothetical protein